MFGISGTWPSTIPGDKRKWNKAWYQPFDTIDKAALGLRFTLHLPVNAMIPPGHWELFKLALRLAQEGGLTPLGETEKALVEEIAREAEPIFGVARK